MRGTLLTIVAVALLALGAAPLARGDEQTRDTYKAQVEPICQANRESNEKIMAGARQRIGRNRLTPAGHQFVRLSGSFGDLLKRLAKVPPPEADAHRIGRWLEAIKLLKSRLRLVGEYYLEGQKIKGNHEAIHAQRAGISANNTTIVLHFRYCHFSNFERGRG